ncbi:3-hydroxyacyl-CoA dehydrogenase family protein [Ectobacillus sp. sgz5001026]|uniref:3-hydroxyacyl-CoA dehydrogenase family protein n=1 Tax=Ectobacillus sp. sgz5001026 TaxID=3242473 RepID=UPI0036D3F4EB
MKKRITVIGAGIMGHGIAQACAIAGNDVHLYDLKEEFIQKATASIQNNLDIYVKQELINSGEKDEILQRIYTTIHLQESVKDADIIIEAIPEVIELKWDLYKSLETMVNEDTIIASNTSTLPLSQLITYAKVPSRFIIAHFFNPAHLVPLVEIVKHETTAQHVVDTTMQFITSIGKTPVLLKKEVPGFIANRLQAALLREALHLLYSGVADAADIDTVIKSGPGFRWAFIGPLETADYGGLDTWKRVLDNLSPELAKDEGAPELICHLVEQNNLGVKTGNGIYNYDKVSVEAELNKRDENFIQLAKIKHAQVK